MSRPSNGSCRAQNYVKFAKALTSASVLNEVKWCALPTTSPEVPIRESLVTAMCDFCVFPQQMSIMSLAGVLTWSTLALAKPKVSIRESFVTAMCDFGVFPPTHVDTVFC